jgi:DNA-binding response OmpR family regulator
MSAINIFCPDTRYAPKPKETVMTTESQCDVLVVEDDTVQCKEIAEFLSDAGLNVKTAHNGSHALRQAAAFRPRVMLLDYNLTDITGVQLAVQLQALLPQTVIIIMSGRIDGLSEQALKAAGIVVFVNKPLPQRPFLRAVLNLVRSAKTNPESTQRPTGWLGTGVGGTQH